MATMDLVDIRTLIKRDPNFRGGRPCIAGTGVSVRRIIGWYKLGYNPEEIVRKYGHLSLAQVYAAIAYYFANQTEMDADEDARDCGCPATTMVSWRANAAAPATYGRSISRRHEQSAGMVERVG